MSRRLRFPWFLFARGGLAAALGMGACSAPAVEPLPAFAACEPDPLIQQAPGTTTVLEIGQMKAAGFVAAASGDEIEIAPWPEGTIGRWYAMVAMRLTLPQDGGPTVCAKILSSLIAGRLHPEGPSGIVMTRGADGLYVAPSVPLDVRLRNTDNATFFDALNKPRTFTAWADTVAGGQIFSGQQMPLDLTPINRKGFLSEPAAGGQLGPGDGGTGTPLFDLRVGVPGATSIVARPGGSVPVHLQLTGQRAGYPVHFTVLSQLPAGIQLQLARTDVPADASDDDAADTLATLQVDAGVAVGLQFDLMVQATAGSVNVTSVTSVNIYPPQGNP